MESYDVIVLGAGVMGSNAAWCLARDAVKVLLLEQFDIGHVNGSSHGQSRIIRRSYNDATYVPLVDLSYRLWRELEAESGVSLLQITGGLDLGEPDSPYLSECRKTMDATGVPYEKLTAADLRRRFPQFQVQDSTIANFQPDGGVLRAGQCVEAAVAMAQKHGAVVRAREPVQSIHVWSGSVEVTTATGKYAAEKLIVTGGSWTGLSNGPGAMLGLKLPLEPLRQRKCYFAPANRAPFEPGRFPVWIWKTYGTVNEEIYGFPWLSGTPGIKIAHHDVDQPKGACDPNNMDRVVEQAYIDKLQAFLRNQIPGATGPYQDGAVCIYTMTPDRDFILDRHPQQSRVVIGAGFSGTGFKFGTGVGRVLADLARDRSPAVELSRFRLERFGPLVQVLPPPKHRSSGPPTRGVRIGGRNPLSQPPLPDRLFN